MLERAPDSMGPVGDKLLLPCTSLTPFSLFVLGLAVLRAVQAELHQCRHRRDLQLQQAI